VLNGARADASDPFLLEGRIGRWRWPWFVLGAVVFAFSAMALQTALVLPAGSPETFEELIALAPGRPAGFLLFAAFGAAAVAAAAIALKFVHEQDPALALGRGGRFSFVGFAKGAGAGALVGALSISAEIIFNPQTLHTAPRDLAHAPWMLFAAAAIFIQAFGEEYAFKGYLARTLGAVIPSPLVVTLALSAAFTALHAGNPDVAQDLVFTLITLFGVEILTYVIYLRTENLGAVTGLHWLNNFAAICLVANAGVQSDAMALAVYEDPILAAGGSRLGDPRAWVEVLLVYGALAALLLWRRSPFHLPPARAGSPAR
jgi:membrane protease YdiL (CAAX protease family)